jgi:hypothetical protein
MAIPSNRDWMMEKLKEANHVANIEPIGENIMLIHRKDGFENKQMPPVKAAVISTKLVTDETLQPLLTSEKDFQFIANLPIRVSLSH